MCQHTPDGSDCNDCGYQKWKDDNLCPHDQNKATCGICEELRRNS